MEKDSEDDEDSHMADDMVVPERIGGREMEIVLRMVETFVREYPGHSR